VGIRTGILEAFSGNFTIVSLTGLSHLFSSLEPGNSSTVRWEDLPLLEVASCWLRRVDVEDVKNPTENTSKAPFSHCTIVSLTGTAVQLP
jgi:hypothetical protein